MWLSISQTTQSTQQRKTTTLYSRGLLPYLALLVPLSTTLLPSLAIYYKDPKKRKKKPLMVSQRERERESVENQSIVEAEAEAEAEACGGQLMSW